MTLSDTGLQGQVFVNGLRVEHPAHNRIPGKMNCNCLCPRMPGEFNAMAGTLQNQVFSAVSIRLGFNAVSLIAAVAPGTPALDELQGRNSPVPK